MGYMTNNVQWPPQYELKWWARWVVRPAAAGDSCRADVLNFSKAGTRFTSIHFLDSNYYYESCCHMRSFFSVRQILIAEKGRNEASPKRGERMARTHEALPKRVCGRLNNMFRFPNSYKVPQLLYSDGSFNFHLVTGWYWGTLIQEYRHDRKEVVDLVCRRICIPP